MPLSPDAPATWPASLPQKPRYGMTEQKQSNVASFQGEIGQPKLRRRSTSVCVIMAATFEMSDAALVDFNIFYELVLKDGSLPFIWNHPRTGISYSWCFAGGESPQIEATTFNFNSVTCKLMRIT